MLNKDKIEEQANLDANEEIVKTQRIVLRDQQIVIKNLQYRLEQAEAVIRSARYVTLNSGKDDVLVMHESIKRYVNMHGEL